MDNYASIRQLMEEPDLKAVLTTNRLVRELFLRAWKLGVDRARHLHIAKQSPRLEKAAMLIDLLSSSSLQLPAMSLLLTSEASWDVLKANILLLTDPFSDSCQPDEAAKFQSKLHHRLAISSSVAIEILIVTYSYSTWGRVPGSQPAYVWSSHYPPSSGLNKKLGSRDDARINTLAEFEERCNYQTECAQKLARWRGDDLPLLALTRTRLVVKVKWKRDELSYAAIREKVQKAVFNYTTEVNAKVALEMEKSRSLELKVGHATRAKYADYNWSVS